MLFVNDSIGFICGPIVLLSTKDGGKSWTRGFENNWTLDLFYDKQNTVFMSGLQESPYCTTDFGNTWKNIFVTDYDLEFRYYSLYSPIENYIWSVGQQGIILQCELNEQGNLHNYQHRVTNLDLYSVYFFDLEKGIIVGSKGTVLKTDDGGNIWEIVDLGVTEDLIFTTFTRNYNCWICGTNGTLLHTNDFVSVPENNNSKKSDFSIFPNPCKNEITVAINESVVSETITIYDLLGNVIKSEKIHNESSDAQSVLRIDMRDVKVGVYILKLSNSNKTKMIVKTDY